MTLLSSLHFTLHFHSLSHFCSDLDVYFGSCPGGTLNLNLVVMSCERSFILTQFILSTIYTLNNNIFILILLISSYQSLYSHAYILLFFLCLCIFHTTKQSLHANKTHLFTYYSFLLFPSYFILVLNFI